MKINLPKHDIIGRTRADLNRTGNLEYVGLKEIPLAYINIEEAVYTPYVNIEDDYTSEEMKIVRPYDEFDDVDTYFFDSEKKQQNIAMKRIGSKYYYEPVNQTEFTPLTFQVYLKFQKQEEFWNDKRYDIKVSGIEISDDQSFVDNLISIFADKYKTDYCPSNIVINGGAKNATSLIEQSWQTADFVFMQSDDGQHLGDLNGEGNLINFEIMLDNNVNVWLFTKDYEGRFKTVTADGPMSVLHMQSNIVFNQTEYEFPRSHMEVFDQDIPFPAGGQNGLYGYYYLNEAILIIHRPNKGFIIVSPDWLLDNLSETGHMIYEGMMYCYLQRYYKSRSATIWITDEPVDYLAYHEKKYNHKHNMVKVKDLMSDYDFDYKQSKLVDVIATSSDVTFLGVNDQEELLFDKISGTPDPEKQLNEQSYYTTKHTVINYYQSNVYLVETPLKVNVTVENSVGYVSVDPMISSKHKIYTTTQQNFKITDFTTEYALYVNQGSSDIENTFFLLDRKVAPKEGYRLVARISFTIDSKTTACDTRLMGGGLPISQTDDFDMLDIGHVYGRPYRIGSTLIIRVPQKLSQFETRIRSELDKHIAAGDEYVLVFE